MVKRAIADTVAIMIMTWPSIFLLSVIGVIVVLCALLEVMMLVWQDDADTDGCELYGLLKTDTFKLDDGVTKLKKTTNINNIQRIQSRRSQRGYMYFTRFTVQYIY